MAAWKRKRKNMQATKAQGLTQSDAARVAKHAVTQEHSMHRIFVWMSLIGLISSLGFLAVSAHFGLKYENASIAVECNKLSVTFTGMAALVFVYSLACLFAAAFTANRASSHIEAGPPKT